MIILVIATASNMKEMREKLSSDELKQQWQTSLDTPIALLNDQMKRLTLKERAFTTFAPAEDRWLNELWGNCLQIENELQVCLSFSSNAFH